MPGDKEWTTLTDLLGGIEAARNKLKSKTGWGDDYNGTDKSKFEAIPCGWTTNLFGFEEIGESGFWCTSTEYNNKHALAFLRGTSRVSSNKQDGLSVRCIKD